MTIKEQEEQEQAYRAAREKQLQMRNDIQARKREQLTKQIEAERKMHARSCPIVNG